MYLKKRITTNNNAKQTALFFLAIRIMLPVVVSPYQSGLPENVCPMPTWTVSNISCTAYHYLSSKTSVLIQMLLLLSK